MTLQNQNSNNEENDSKRSYSRIKPRYGAWTNDNKMILQIALPGVNKDKLSMKAIEDYFTLRAYRDDIEYILDLDLGVKIEPEKTEVRYEEGLLTLEFQRYRPLEHAFNVPIQ
ncbi:Hsp20/alpha crystallin family protein [Promethearchaeum syntrophicum]|jgi:HSP20 family molecular chaperone IbpA|uniref:Hsp20/alpha crystallin family protein n=1 Tax=Promethearchaeum syntrophicum TaxID=2594042 RepID=A0A5B9D609_9ARCH|nr:Hsp20/alpha crystallin family protein [Candidatus Prometheoarchaeum syntrophicum]QEE14416.1 hypothetical protein DSAG12_00229 [Candidatus Prometheoarchaeum syntrophicum]